MHKSRDGAVDGRRESAGLLTQADIDEFKRLVKETTGTELTNYEAWSRATALVGLYRMMLKPIPEDPERTLD